MGTGQPEPLDFLICPTELCLFGFCKILKCFGRYIIKTYDGNTGNEKILGTEQRWVFSGWTYLIKAKHPWLLGLCIQPTTDISTARDFSKIASLLTKQCCYQQEADEPNVNLGMDFQGSCPILPVLASFDNLTYFLFKLFFLFCTSFSLNRDFIFYCIQNCYSFFFFFNLPGLMFSIFQVAIHSVLEKLFRSIWSLPNSRAPFAIKYFFDFLDAQAENKKITDPDVVHIWKTNRWEQTVGDYWLFKNLGQNLNWKEGMDSHSRIHHP